MCMSSLIKLNEEKWQETMIYVLSKSPFPYFRDGDFETIEDENTILFYFPVLASGILLMSLQTINIPVQDFMNWI